MLKLKMKCANCQKRTHLAFSCSCKKEFCVKCRTPEIHQCGKIYEPPILPPKVVAEKLLDKI